MPADDAEVLNAAIDFAFEKRRATDDIIAMDWLDEWRHGDPSAMQELEDWRKARRTT